MLLAHDGIEVNKVRSDDGAAPLYTACNLGHTGAVRTLLADERANIEKVSQDGEPPLHTSAWSGHLLCAQLLIIHGASLSAKNNTDETAAESAITDNQPILAEWLTVVTGWSHLRVAAGCRLYKDAAVALRLGRMDPDADDSPQPAAMVQELMAAIATSKAAPAALPWQDAPPICKDTIKLVVAATRGWSRATHGLHHGKVREAVFAVLIVAGRLERNSNALAALATATEHDGDGDADADALTTSIAPLPVVLPIEMWTFLMQFFKRSWWEADIDTTL